MDMVTVSAQPRKADGGKAAADVRAAGMVPAVVYGKGMDTLAISVEAKQLGRLIHEAGSKATLSLAVEGGPTATVRIQEVQRGKVSRELVHIDFILVGE